MQSRRRFHSSLLLAVMTVFAGCSSARQSTHPAATTAEPVPALAPPVADDSAVAMVRRLEGEPLASDAGDLRGTVFAWVVGSERLHRFSATTLPVDGLQGSSYPYRDELMMQYIFGAAAFAIVPGEGGADSVEQQAAGIRSMIAAYRNILLSAPTLHDPFLDRLDDIRRRGELRLYVQKMNRQ